MTSPSTSARQPAPSPDYSFLDRAGAESIFFPRSDRRPPPAGANDYQIAVNAETTVAARFYVADPSYPSLLYFHGNGEIAADHDDIAPLYGRIGLNLLVAEFRGYGQSSGRPTFEHLVADAQPVTSFFHDLLDGGGFDPRRYLMGRSLGSHPALEIAARYPDRFSGLIIESGAANIRRLLARLGVSDSAEGDALADAHDAKLGAIGLRTLIIHGAVDELVPVSQARLLRDLLANAERELLVIDGAGHNDLLWVGREAYFAAIQQLTSPRSG